MDSDHNMNILVNNPLFVNVIFFKQLFIHIYKDRIQWVFFFCQNNFYLSIYSTLANRGHYHSDISDWNKMNTYNFTDSLTPNLFF